MTDDSGISSTNPIKKLLKLLDAPVSYFRESVVEPIQSRNPKTAYYHRQYRRVPGIDECDVRDAVCIHEANTQFKRDKLVDTEILNILRQRKLECQMYYGPDSDAECKKQIDDYKDTETNWFVKYGEIGYTGTVIEAYMKQKHRMVWERRHGEVGSGRKQKE